MNSNYKKLFTTIGITGIAYIINFAITMFLTPVITGNIGTEAYGFVTLAKNLAQYSSYFTMALNSFATRFISVEYHKQRYDKANEYFSSVFFGDIALGSALYTVGILIMIFVDRIFNVPAEIVRDVRFLFLFIFTRTFITIIMAANECGPIIANKLYVNSIAKLIGYAVEATILITLFNTLKPHLYFVGIALFAAAMMEVITNAIVRKRFTKELEIKRSNFRFKAVKLLVVNGIWSSVNSLGNFLHSGLDIMITNLMLSPLAMGQLAIAEQIALIFKSLYTIVSSPFHPLYLKAYAAGDKESLLKYMFLAMKVCSMITGICFAGFYAIGERFYEIWIPAQDTHLIWMVTMISITSCITGGIISPINYGYTLTLKKKIPCFMTLITGLLNVISMYFLIKYTSLGLYAVAGTTTVLMISLHLVAHPIYLAYALKLPKMTFYPVMARCCIATLAVSVIFKVLSKFYLPHGWTTFALTVIIYAMIGGIVHPLISMNREEKEAVFKKIRRRTHHA